MSASLISFVRDHIRSRTRGSYFGAFAYSQSPSKRAEIKGPLFSLSIGWQRNQPDDALATP